MGDWRLQANCAGLDPQLFHPDTNGDHRTPKEVCQGCVVREACLAHALAHGETFGIWGGMSERERRLLARSAAPREPRSTPSCCSNGHPLTPDNVRWRVDGGKDRWRCVTCDAAAKQRWREKVAARG